MSITDTDDIICAACTATIPPMVVCHSCGEPTLLDDHYRLTEIVGQGSFGMTYRAEDTETGTTVAIKEMLVRSVDTLKAVELFEREADVLERLDHPNIPTYYDDFWREDGRATAFFVVQQFVDGDVVAEMADGPNRPQRVFDLLEQLLETLAYLHEFSPPVVHRDVKPANLMIREDDGSVVLIDFGSVQAALQPDEGGSTVAGTFGYMAPEQFTGHAEPRSDVYGAAATALGLLTASEPTPNRGSDTVPADLDRLELHPAYRELMAEMMAPDPTGRPSAAEAADRLRDLEAAPGDTGAQSLPAPPADAGPLAGLDISAPVRRALANRPRTLPPNFEHEYEPNPAGWRLDIGCLALTLCLVVVFSFAAFDSTLSAPIFVASLVVFIFAYGRMHRPSARTLWKSGKLGRARRPRESDDDTHWVLDVGGGHVPLDRIPDSLADGDASDHPDTLPVLYMPNRPEENLAVSEVLLHELEKATARRG